MAMNEIDEFLEGLRMARADEAEGLPAREFPPGLSAKRDGYQWVRLDIATREPQQWQ